jgi:bifunctional DNase/RNase
MVRMDIQTVVMGSLQMASLVVLKKHDENGPQVHLPIRIGPIEAAAITASIEDRKSLRPLTHDLLSSVIDSLGARLSSICIVDVRGTTFYATLQLVRSDGSRTEVDCRPSDAIALALRSGAPIFAHEQVLSTATMPDFSQAKKDVEEQELQAFHDFVEGLSPEDFG